MRRLGVLVVGVLVMAGGLACLMLAFTSRDEPEVSPASGPGQAFADQCAEHRDAAGFEFNSRPPTSGPHQPDLVSRDAVELSTDQLLHALELGNVVLAYDTARPPDALRRVQREVAGPFDAELAAAGQAVILARRGDAGGVAALAWRHLQRGSSPGDPALQSFADAWLGQGIAAAGAARCRR